MNKRKYPSVNIGSASMLVIFIVLCLVTFSVLSVASANSGRTYARNIAARTKTYYESSGKAEAQLAKLDVMLAAFYETYGDDYLKQGADIFDPEMLETFDFPLELSDFPAVSFEVPLGDTQALAVTVTLQVPKSDGDPHKNALYEITSWKEISTKGWENDEPLKLM